LCLIRGLNLQQTDKYLMMARSNITLGPSTDLNTFSYYEEANTSNPVSYIYPKDLDGDGVDEVMFVAFETQPNTPSEYTNTSVHIFGWRNNSFQEITEKWLPNDANLVEGVGDVAFGDFNGDGLLDAFLSAYTDMDHATNAYVLYNQGGVFRKESLGLQTWQHSVRSYDINYDGYDDVIPVGYADMPRYLGSANGLIKYQGFTGGSGLALGDFLGNGSASVVFLDAGSGVHDTYLYELQVQNEAGIVATILVNELPGPRLENGTPRLDSHDIRAIPFDFTDDGLLDVICISYAFNFNGTEGLRRSEIQFLKNLGDGKFEDVTDEFLVGFDGTGYLGYYPQLVDVNFDGRLDLFLSSPDWLEKYNSTTLLLQLENGKFFDTGRTLLNEAIDGGQGAIAKGPASQFYLLKEAAGEWNSPYTKINLFKINLYAEDADEVLYGTNGNDKIYGFDGNDFIDGKSGDDYIDGGDGVDTASYSSSLTEIIKTSVGYSVGGDTLINIERINFSNTSVALDTDGATSAGGIYRLYKATFNREPDTGGLGYWIAQADAGSKDAVRMAEDFTWSAEFQSLYNITTTDNYGTGTDVSELVTGFYENVLGRSPDAGGLNYYTGVIESHEKTVGRVLAEISDSPENYDGTIALIANGILFDPWGA
jgi:hypothetical protein